MTKHIHDFAEYPVVTWFAAKENADSTEGRGPMVTVGIFTIKDDAYKAIKGHATMGQGDGDVYLLQYWSCMGCSLIKEEETIIYHGSNYTQKNTIPMMRDFALDGWRKDFSPMFQDPEYVEYVRLKDKFKR